MTELLGSWSTADLTARNLEQKLPLRTFCPSRIAQYSAVCQVYLRAPGTAQDSPGFKLLWGGCCQASVKLTEFPAQKVIWQFLLERQLPSADNHFPRSGLRDKGTSQLFKHGIDHSPHTSSLDSRFRVPSNREATPKPALQTTLCSESSLPWGERKVPEAKNQHPLTSLS